MLSIIIPVLDGTIYTDKVLQDIKKYTEGEYEVLIMVSWYDTETFKNCSYLPETFVQNKDVWVNGARNEGVKQARGEYIAILNNDLELSQGRDTKLIEGLKDCKLTSPAYTVGEIKDGKIYKHNRFNEQNICGHCFCMRKEDYPEIPEEIKIWFGDNWIYEKIKGNQKCIEDCVIHHYESKTMKSSEFADLINERVLQDKKNWFIIKKQLGN